MGLEEHETAGVKDNLLSLALAFAAALPIAIKLRFSQDEFSYAHAGWLISKGELPYRDFAIFHPPLVDFFLAPLFFIAGDSVGALLAARVAFGLMFLFSAIMLQRWSRSSSGLVMLLAVTFGVFPTFMTELRPDSLALFLTLLAILAVEKSRLLPGAVLLGLAAFTSEKVALYGLAIPIALVWNDRRFARALRFSFAAFAVALVCYAALVAAAGWEPSFEFLIRWPLRHESFYPYRSPFGQMAPFAIEYAVYGVLAVLGLYSTFKREATLPERALALVLVLGFVSYVMQRGTFAYSLLPFVAPLVYFAACGIERSLPLKKKWVLRTAVLWMLCFAAIHSLPKNETNSDQIAMLWDADRRVSSGDCIYDNSGTVVDRPQARFFFFTDALVRTLKRDEMNREVPKEIMAKGCTAMVVDHRFLDLSPDLQSWLRKRFPNCFGDLCLVSP